VQQQEAPVAVARHFVYRLIPRAVAGSVEVRDVMAEHLTYWAGLFDAGHVVVAGPVSTEEGVYGLAVVQAADEAEVLRLAAADPAIIAGVADFEVLAMPSAWARPDGDIREHRRRTAAARPRARRGRPANRR
jgi:uncharacterized protein YciI